MITAVAHNAIKVTDMEKALDFYCNTIGFKKAFEIADDSGNPWIVYLKICNNAFVELFYDGIKDRERAYSSDVIGYHHFCIAIGDIQPLAQKLYEKGIITESKPGEGRDFNRNIWIHDQDGNAVEFVEYNPDSPHMKANASEYDFSAKGYTGIGHMAYTVENMEASLDFYINKLGFTEIYKLDDEQGNPWLIYLRVKDGTYIELFYGGVKKAEMKHESAGFMHTCLACDDVYKTVEELRAKGVPIDVEPSQGKDLNYQAWTHDPDGNKIELMTIDPNSFQTKASCED